MKKRYLFLLIYAVICIGCSIPELLHQNEGKSKAIGSVRNGKLENAWLFPYSGPNFRYFSPLSYFILNNAYTHSTTWKVVMDAYETCEKTCPGIQFRLMECSKRDGGKMLIHRTHQNGTSIDFMVPKKNQNGQTKWIDWIGMWHYLLDFDSKGRLLFAKGTEIDFETLGKHILAVDDAAHANGMRIRKIILREEVVDDLYRTDSGKEVKRRGIYLVRGLHGFVNQVHDDHYHVDFVFK